MTPDEIRATVKTIVAPIYEAAQLEAQKQPSHETALAVASIAAGIALATDILVALQKLANPVYHVPAPQIDMLARIDAEDRIRVLLRPFVDVDAPAPRQLVNALADMVVRPE